MENSKITIAFKFIDEFGNEWRSESTEEPFDENDCDFIGRQLNNFLTQCGYHRPNPLIYMDSVSEEEYDAIDNFLREYRESSTEV